MRKATLLAVALLTAAACGTEREPLPGGPSSERLTLKPSGSVEGAPLGYIEYLPPGYGDGASRPLLVFLHGAGESGNGSETSLKAVFKLGIPRLIESDEWPEARPFIVLMPQYGNEEAAGDCSLAQQVARFLAFAIDRYDVDESRVYLTGMSCGAIGAWDYLATEGEEVVAAAVLIAGHAEDAWEKAGCALGVVPVWVFHGGDDEIVPKRFVVQRIAELRACDPAPDELRLTLYPGADHNAWGPTYSLSAGHDVYAWLLQHEVG